MKKQKQFERIQTSMMKSLLSSRDALAADDSNKRVLKQIDQALMLSFAGKEVIWPDQQSPTTQKSLTFGTPDRIHTPTTDRKTPARSIVRSVSKSSTKARGTYSLICFLIKPLNSITIALRKTTCERGWCSWNVQSISPPFNSNGEFFAIAKQIHHNNANNVASRRVC